ncbi:leucyl-tRNA synthetase [Fibrella aestuarina BUZ 2]|uniref:leucine--tRNA ligase n=1 Tax=Fibrella aestuarina BUZ 2 TaxID=1166018 RepID=I0K987_9BACT|nr:leucyl-tRNA synthetase [Fibrella aestuarina BUZ 2]
MPQAEGYEYELSTMPGWAGSSWYWYRYMDPQNTGEFASRAAIDYWQDVDLYMGGSEHATGHLLYSRFWNKFLKDRGYVPQEEPFKKLINQGMIQGRSMLVYRLEGTGMHGQAPVFVSAGLKDQYQTTELHVDVNIVNNDVLDTEAFRNWLPDYANAEFVLENGKYICGSAVEKMSKRYYNVVNPDDVAERYGSDVLRLYEMFLGPLEQAKPWSTSGIDGTFRFLRKLWRLFYKDVPNTDDTIWIVTDEAPTKEELKVLHKTIKKAQEDIEHYSFNTSVSAFMVCVNELATLKCHKRAILQELVLLVSPYAPHIAEELWAALGNVPGTVSKATYPAFNPQYLVEEAFEYPIQINGKVRTTISFPLDQPSAAIEQDVLANEVVQKWLEGKTPKKIVVVPKRIVNVVL